jgi:acetyl-CoA carboxylase biotin carboxyl carrier protein
MANKRKSSLEKSSARSAVLPALAPSASLLDVEALRQIVEVLETSDVTQLTWRRGEERLTIRRGQPPTTIVQAIPTLAAPVAAEPPVVEQGARIPPAPAKADSPRPKTEEKPGQLVTSPFVGTFYRTPAPDQPPFVELGAVVRKGQVLCIIEAMKLMNEIEAEVGGKIAEIFVENGQSVEFGQPLLRIEPS